jgi:hypothetical protein
MQRRSTMTVITLRTGQGEERRLMQSKQDVLGRGVAVVVAVRLGAVTPGWAADADGDGVDDAVDACPDTVSP